MLRQYLTPKWLGGHLFTVAAIVVCVWLGWWQLARFESPTGGAQNAAYALQWPVFAGFFAFFWYRAVRDARGGPVPRLRPPPVRASDEQRELIRQHEAADPQLAAYNRYLAELNAGTARTS